MLEVFLHSKLLDLYRQQDSNFQVQLPVILTPQLAPSVFKDG